MINIYLIIYFIYIFSVGLIYLYKSQTKIGEYKPLLLFIVTILTVMADIITCILNEIDKNYIKLVNFIISHVLTSLILGLNTYRFISFYINNVRIKNSIKNINNTEIEKKNKIIFTSIFSLFISSLIYSSVIFVKYKEIKIYEHNWQYYPIYFVSISFFIIIMPMITYLLKGIYKNMYECYLTLSMGFLGCFIAILFNFLNIDIKAQYILVISNFIIINILYLKPLYTFFYIKKNINKSKNINNLDNLNEIYEKELNFLKEYQIFINKIQGKDNESLKVLYLEFYNKNIIDLKEKYEINYINENIIKDMASSDIFDKFKNDILNNMHCKLYKSLLNE